jgi:hypothetical protein
MSFRINGTGCEMQKWRSEIPDEIFRSLNKYLRIGSWLLRIAVDAKPWFPHAARAESPHLRGHGLNQQQKRSITPYDGIREYHSEHRCFSDQTWSDSWSHTNNLLQARLRRPWTERTWKRKERGRRKAALGIFRVFDHATLIKWNWILIPSLVLYTGLTPNRVQQCSIAIQFFYLLHLTLLMHLIDDAILS